MNHVFKVGQTVWVEGIYTYGYKVRQGEVVEIGYSPNSCKNFIVAKFGPPGFQEGTISLAMSDVFSSKLEAIERTFEKLEAKRASLVVQQSKVCDLIRVLREEASDEEKAIKYPEPEVIDTVNVKKMPNSPGGKIEEIDGGATVRTRHIQTGSDGKTMTVKELIEELKECAQDAFVYHEGFFLRDRTEAGIVLVEERKDVQGNHVVFLVPWIIVND